MSALAQFIGEAPSRSGAAPLSAEFRQREQRKLKIARLLLEKGADVGAADSNGMTALHVAVSATADAEASRIVLEILRRGARVDARTLAGVTPLQLAILGRQKAVTTVLVAHGADVSIANSRGETAASLAAANGMTGALAGRKSP